MLQKKAIQTASIKEKLPKVKVFIQVNDGTVELPEFSVDFEDSISNNDPMERQERSGENIYMLYRYSNESKYLDIVGESIKTVSGLLDKSPLDIVSGSINSPSLSIV